MSATNGGSNGRASADVGGERYAHVSIDADEVIIYNPDATDEWLQSTNAVAIEEWI